MPVHNHMPAAQELDGDALGMLVSCLCGTGSDQKVAARRVRPAMQQAAGRHSNTLLGFTGQECQNHVLLKAPVCLQECVRGLGRLATDLCPVRSLVLQPLILLKIIAYLRSRCKVVPALLRNAHAKLCAAPHNKLCLSFQHRCALRWCAPAPPAPHSTLVSRCADIWAGTG